MKEPFVQLWSIHAFARVDDQLKMLPLAFVAMSSQRKIDYQHVLRCVCSEVERIVPNNPEVSVQEVVCDFEKAVWQAVKEGKVFCMLNI